MMKRLRELLRRVDWDRIHNFYKPYYLALVAVYGIVLLCLNVIVTAVGWDVPAAKMAVVAMLLAVVAVAAGVAVWLWYDQPDTPPPLPDQSTGQWRAMPFTAADPFPLPGKKRRDEAVKFADAIARDDFRFGVVSGKTGCGKSSFLDSGVYRKLRDNRIPSVFVTRPRGLVTRSVSPKDRFDHVLDELAKRAAAARAAAEKTPVILIDQFEEFFIDFPAKTKLKKLGSRLLELATGDARVKIVCGVRHDFYVRLHHFTPQFSLDVLFGNVKVLDGLEPEDAESAIEDIARESGQPVGPGFASRLVKELTEDEQVLPTTLQILCIALSGNLTVDAYERQDKAGGILRAHVAHAVEKCRDRPLAKKILRALCNFRPEVRAKTGPVAARVLRQESPSISVPKNFDLHGDVFHHLLRDRLVARDEGTDGEDEYTLTADYLVEPIARVTDDEVTRREAADQALRAYRRAADDRGGLRWWWVLGTPPVPRKERRTILRYANPVVLGEPMHRSLLRQSYARSWCRGVAAAAFLLVAVLGFGFGLALAGTRKEEWVLESVDRHWPEKLQGSVITRVVKDGDGNARRVITLSVAPPFALTQSVGVVQAGGVSPFGPTYFSPGTVAPVAPTGEPRVSEPTSPKWYLRQWKADTGDRVNGRAGRFIPPLVPDAPIVELTEHTTPQGPITRIESRTLDCLDQIAWQREIARGAEGIGTGLLTQRGSYTSTPILIEPAARDADGRFVIRATSLADGRELGRTALPGKTFEFHHGGRERGLVVSKTPEKKETDRSSLYVWNYGGAVEKLWDYTNDPQNSYLVGTMDAKVAALTYTSNGAEIRYWPAKDRAAVVVKPLESKGRAIWISFTPDEEHLVLYSPNFGDTAPRLEFLSLTDLQSARAAYPGTLDKPIKSARIVPQEEDGTGWLAWPVEERTVFWDGRGTRHSPKGPSLEGRSLIVARSGKTTLAMALTPPNHFEVWELADEGKKVIAVDVSGSINGAGFTLDRKAVYVMTEGGVVGIYPLADGGRPAAELTGVGGDRHIVGYDSNSHRVVVWTSAGRILRYQKRWTSFLDNWTRSAPNRPEPWPGDELIAPVELQTPPGWLGGPGPFLQPAAQ